MLRKNHRTHHGAWRINTAQSIIFLIAAGSLYAVFSAYQKSQVDETALVAPAAPPNVDPRHVKYAKEIAKWQTQLEAQQMTLVWPYNNQDYAARLELPDKIPITLAAWDETNERKVAIEAYQSFVNVRFKAKVANPTSCIVHVFVLNPETSTMENVMDASAAGVGSPGG